MPRGALSLLVTAIALNIAASAQSVAPQFEVSSVKTWIPRSSVHVHECTGDRFVSSGVYLGDVLRWAYELGMKGTAHGEFLRAAPEELRLTRYEIQGKASSPFASEADCRAMVRSLLADRFKLAFHWEDREADIFYLVVAPGGLKLQKALPSDEGTDVRFVVNGITTITFPPIVDPVERAQTKGMTMSELAARLPIDSLLPIVDDTGLTERYKIDLRYSTVLSTDSLDGPNDPLIGAALAKVGLRVEKRRGIAKVRVLDHIEEPDAN